jgi:hypothetical protein
MGQQGLAVLEGAIAAVAIKAIGRPALGQALQEGITALLSQDAGAGDAEVEAVAPHQGLLGPRPGPEGQVAIHQHQGRGLGQALQGPQHRQLGGYTNAQPINFLGRPLTKAIGLGHGKDLRHQSSPAPGAKQLAVSNP